MRDADGKKALSAVRRQRSLGEVKHIDKVPYRLPEILSSRMRFSSSKVRRTQTIFSEKSVSQRRVTLAARANGWNHTMSTLRIKMSLSFPTTMTPDAITRKRLKTSLRGTAKSIKIVELPGLEEKGDVSDWIDNGGTKEALDEIVNSTKAVQQTVEEVSKLKSIRLPSPAFPYEVISRSGRQIHRDLQQVARGAARISIHVLFDMSGNLPV